MSALCGMTPLTAGLVVELANSVEGGQRFLSLFHKGEFLSFDSLSSDSDPDAYLLSELLSKFPFDIGIDRKKVALDKWSSVESDLHSVDLGLRDLYSGRLRRPDAHWVFHLARVKIRNLLPNFCWDRCERWMSFGPGASVGLPRRRAFQANKYGSLKPSVTRSCLDLAVAGISRHSVWVRHLTDNFGENPSDWFTLVPGNKVVTVPKNAKTDRVIAIEPLMNMYIQKGIGGWLRTLLKSKGVDLDDQTLNQRRSHLGSVTGSLATLDLSSASDSISRLLVELLLPPDWVSAIEASRSPYGVLPDGSIHYYRKVSSMGNGFTFELESLIFWALCSATAEYHGLSGRSVSVYGDDLIVPTETVPTLVDVLSLAGFTTNKKKSHFHGNFRESCGKHFMEGSDVTPFYIRENVDAVVPRINFCNSIRTYAFRRMGSVWGCDRRFEAAWTMGSSVGLAQHLPKGPLWLNGQMSDSCLGVDFDSALPSVKRAKNQLDGYSFPRLVDTSRVVFPSGIGSLIGNLDRKDRGLLPECGFGRVTTSKGRYRLTSGFVQRWQDAGPWL